jgi:uncharacterized protein YbjT (DUF2867 family)
MSIKIVVTGAGGRTGSLVLQKLLKIPNVEAYGLVRSEKSAGNIYKVGGKKENVVLADVTNLTELESAFKGADKVILCTSAVPKIKIFSIIKTIVLKLFRKTSRPEFTFPPNGDPYNVDWLGAKNQIDAAKKVGVKQFVFLSSMGGTQPDNFLNTIGKVEGDEKSGNILLWKRKAEEYLISSGIPYTIVHPGGLLDKKGGEREIVFNVDDKLIDEKLYRAIPREDVAEVCVQSLFQNGALKRSFDIASKEPGVGVVTNNWEAFFKQSGNCKYN